MNKTHYIVPIFVPDLGCPHRCVFCSQQRITGQQAVPTPADVTAAVEQHLATIPDNPGLFREVAFFGGSFTAIDQNLQRQLLAPAYRFLAQGRIEGIRVSTRPDAVSEEILSLLTAYGVSTIELGVQSMDDEVLYLSGRGHTSRDVIRAAALIKSWGLTLGFQMMVGLPGDTREKDIYTAEVLLGLQPDLVRIYPCLVLEGTALADLYRQGRYEPLSLDEAVDICKDLLLAFEKAGVNVIRIGLQPSDRISLEGDVLAGPYHPAFRELVESAVRRDLLTHLLTQQAGVTKAGRVKIAVSPRDISVTRGHGGSNLDFLKREYGITELITFPDPDIKPGQIRLLEIDGKEFGITVSR